MTQGEFLGNPIQVTRHKDGQTGRFGVLFCIPTHPPVLPVNDALMTH